MGIVSSLPSGLGDLAAARVLIDVCARVDLLGVLLSAVLPVQLYVYRRVPTCSGDRKLGNVWPEFFATVTWR